ncbi:MAG: helix-turn-helix domain-containing protein [Solirubrobacterales bacterium]
MSDPISIGAEIRQARLAGGVSQASLARRAGTSQAAISRIERGLEMPGPERTAALLASLGLRLRLELEPIAEMDPDRRQLQMAGEISPGARLRGAMKDSQFADDLRRAAQAAIEQKALADRERERTPA